jgi:RNA polymerase sigma factor (TIGR02999 family)
MSKPTTRLIVSTIEQGDARAASELLPLVYQELRRLAAQRLAHEQPGHTLQATALVHEAYLRLLGDGPDGARWDGRAHFFAAAAEAMRRILIDSARRKKRLRHGGGQERAPVDPSDLDDGPAYLPFEELRDDLLALDEALARLEEVDAVKAQLVKLRYFGGLTLEEAGRVLRISPATADRYWAFARAWLYNEMHGGEQFREG